MPRRSLLIARTRPSHGSTGATSGSGALFAFALAGFTGAIVQTILVPIQPVLPALLNAPASLTAWGITVTALVSAVVTPVAGRVGDMFGKRRTAIAMMLVLIAGCVVAGTASSVEWLIIGRGLQGAGLGVTPLGIAILRDVMPPRRVASGMAIMSATMGVGGAIGLPLSAFVVGVFDWHALFWVASLLGALSIGLVLIFVPARDRASGGRFDVVGVLGLALIVTAVLLLLSEGARWPAAVLAGVGILAVVVFALWVLFELRVKDPLVDLRVASRGPVLMTNITSTALGFALFSANLTYPQILERPVGEGGMGLSLIQAALVVTPLGLAMLAASVTVGPLLRRVRPKWILMLGALMIAGAYGTNLLLVPSTMAIFVACILVGLGIGFGYAAIPSLIMRAVPASEGAAANGLNALMRSFGNASAAAVTAAILTNAVQADGSGAAEGFRGVFIAGLGAACICATLATLIPAPARDGREL